MKYSILLLFGLLLFSCSDSQLRAENEELRLELAHAKKTAELEAGSARESEARAFLAMREAKLAMENAEEAESHSRAAQAQAEKQRMFVLKAQAQSEKNLQMALAAQREADELAMEASKQVEISKLLAEEAKKQRLRAEKALKDCQGN